MNAKKFIIIKKNRSGIEKEVKRYFKSNKIAKDYVKQLNKRAQITGSDNKYVLK